MHVTRAPAHTARLVTDGAEVQPAAWTSVAAGVAAAAAAAFFWTGWRGGRRHSRGAAPEGPAADAAPGAQLLQGAAAVIAGFGSAPPRESRVDPMNATIILRFQ